MPDFAFESEASGLVCGIDEVGRGPLAGPVVAAAVIFERGRVPARLYHELDDSKKLSASAREQQARLIIACARIGIGAASVAEIDRHNILQASFIAMRRAVSRLGVRPDLALVDGNRAPVLPCLSRTIIGGDGRSLSIAAASVVAKVTRDKLMRALASRYQGYGWETNFGYPTAAHREALARLGLTPHHRRSFGPCQLSLGIDSNFPD
jgi:ribonuclease HII